MATYSSGWCGTSTQEILYDIATIGSTIGLVGVSFVAYSMYSKANDVGLLNKISWVIHILMLVVLAIFFVLSFIRIDQFYPPPELSWVAQLLSHIAEH